MSRGQILVVPAFEHGRGGGHLSRCAKLTNELRLTERNAYLYLPSIRKEIENLFQFMNFNFQWIVTEIELRDISDTIEFIVLDRFQTSKTELLRWKEIAPVIGIDEGGKFRDRFDFLIDILIPEKTGVPAANITNPSFLNFPSRTLSQKQSSNGETNIPRPKARQLTGANARGMHIDFIKILVSFGQEDPAGLGVLVLRKLYRQNNGSLDITFLTGELSNKQIETRQNIKVLKSIPRLSEHLSEYDLVITHYGITAYEALYAGTTVILVNPTYHHKKVSKAAGFYTAVNLPEINHAFLEKLKKHCKEQISKLGQDKENKSLANLVNLFYVQVNRFCPVCKKEANSRSAARLRDRTYRHCPNCGIIYMDRSCPPPIEYEKEYFFEAYKKQYGKTYLEDFPNLVAMAKRRLKIISMLSRKGAKAQKKKKDYYPPMLLDIGCAYGPFLSAAREEGFSPAGIDPAQDAVRYVQETLNIPAVQGFFPNCPPPFPRSPLYDVITLWYVIEHFTDCLPVLAEIKKLLKPGGILAFSTPSFSGVSGRKSLSKFLENSPADHYTIWSPKTCKKALALAGFKVKKIVISGLHPERFPLLGKFAKSKKSPLYWLLLAVSKILCLGDTFEVYAKSTTPP